MPELRTRTAIKRALVVVESEASRRLVDEIEDAAAGNSPLLIQGARGTGRELIARLIHLASPRKSAPFVAVEAGAAPRGLASDGLQWQTGGPLAEAAGGTLLIKSLCSLPRPSQRRVAGALRAWGRDNDGGSASDVRVVGAGDGDVEEAVEAGLFSRELYERLAGRRICVPRLAERSADIPPLARHFVREHAEQLGRERMTLSTRAYERLLIYPWPGNIAELKDIARRLVIRTKKTRIDAGDVDAVLPIVAERIPMEDMSLEEVVRAKLGAFLKRVEGYSVTGFHQDIIERVEKPMLDLVMLHTGGNQLRAAEILGLNRNTLRRKLAEHGLRARTLRAASKRAAASSTADKNRAKH